MVSRQANSVFYRGVITKLVPLIFSIGAFFVISVYSPFDIDKYFQNPHNFWVGLLFGANAFVFFFEGFGVLDKNKNGLVLAGTIVIILAILSAFISALLLGGMLDFTNERGDINKMASIILFLSIVSHALWVRLEVFKGQTLKERLEV